MPTAVALNSMTFNLARAIGPATAALAVEYLGIPAAFGLNAVSYLIFIGALLYIGPQAQQLAERGRRATCARASSSSAGGRSSSIFLLIVAAVGFASDPVNTLAPAWANAFGRKDTVAGYIIGVFGAGAVTAGLVVAGRVGGSQAPDVHDAADARPRDGRLLDHALAAARAAVPVRRRLRLPRLEHARDLAAAARRRAVGARPDHGALERRVPRPAAVREHHRRRDRERVRRPLRRRAAGAAGAGVRRLDRVAGADARLGRGAGRAAARERPREPRSRCRTRLRAGRGAARSASTKTGTARPPANEVEM